LVVVRADRTARQKAVCWVATMVGRKASSTAALMVALSAVRWVVKWEQHLVALTVGRKVGRKAATMVQYLADWMADRKALAMVEIDQTHKPPQKK